MSEHAKLSPSASDRWLVCPVAPSREALVPDKGSAAAEWGTAAHAMSEHCLNKEINAADARPDIRWDKYDGPDMRECVQEYLDFVRAKLINGGHLFVEQKLQVFPLQQVWGTADAVIVGHEPGLLDVIDLKGGMGVLVEAESSSQLKLYAWGAYQSLEWLSETYLDRIRVTIVQPRRGHVVSKTFEVGELKEWALETQPKVRAAFNDEGPAVAGEHCRWCRVRATCAERREFIQGSAAMVFGAECEKPDVVGMDEAAIVQVFKHVPLIQQYLKDVEGWVHAQSLERGEALPGLKWVAGRSTRFISNEAGAVQALCHLDINPYSQPKLLGVTELTKLLKDKGEKFNDVLGPFIDKTESAPILVPVEDKRPDFDKAAAIKEAFSS